MPEARLPGVVRSDDGREIRPDVYAPAGPVTGVIQILHGLGEHAGRYARFADAATARGRVVCVHNHRGHGPAPEVAGHFADRGGWHLLIADAVAVNRAIHDTWPGLTVTLFGHSMGSFLAQHFAMHYGARIRALVLSGSTRPSPGRILPGLILARLEMLRLGKRGYSPLLDRAGFGAFNRRFRPARTAFDWLSRDPAEVDAYIADPLCGGPFTCRLWVDLLGGLLEVGSRHAITRIPAELPILILGGENDPVGGDRGMTLLAMLYAVTGHQRLAVRSYPDARHEMLNEVNRHEVTAAILDWIEKNARPAVTSHIRRSG